MASSANNIVISPVNVLWRIEANHQITMVADVADSLDGKYFTLMGTHYVWFDGVAAADPAPAGLTAIPVAYTTGDSAATLAGLVATAIDGLGDFNATASGAVVDVFADAVGSKTDSADVDAGVSVVICRRGKNFDLGLLEGDIEFNYTPSLNVVTSQQTGVTPRAALYQGAETIEATTVMQETQNSNLKEIYGLFGTSGFTPSTSEVFGIGTSKQGQNILVDAARLTLKDVNAVDETNNRSFMLAVPTPESLIFSGENPRTLSITWQGYIDDTVDSRVSAILFGDELQAGL